MTDNIVKKATAVLQTVNVCLIGVTTLVYVGIEFYNYATGFPYLMLERFLGKIDFVKRGGIQKISCYQMAYRKQWNNPYYARILAKSSISFGEVHEIMI